MFQDNSFFEEKYSSIINVKGPDKFSFLQGIISNDTEILKTKLSLYAAILSPQGKFLSDFILSIYEDDILIEIKSKNILNYYHRAKERRNFIDAYESCFR